MDRKLLVDQYTTPFVSVVAPDHSTLEIMGLMKENDVRHLPVIENNKIVGIISERDLRIFSLNKHWAEKFTAKDIMTKNPYIVSLGTSLEHVISTMRKRKIGSAIVVDEKETIRGIFTSTDALFALDKFIKEIQQNGENEFKLTLY